MLKSRVISAMVGLPIVLLVLLVGGKLLTFIVMLLAMFSLYELFNAFQNIGYKPSMTVAYIITIFYYFLLLIGLDTINIFLLVLFLFLVLMFINTLIKDSNIIDGALTILGIIYLSFLFSFILLIQNLPYGNYLIWLPFISGWASDTSAYFIGNAFGKKKLSKKISPNKTIEGAIGGVLGSMIFCIIFGGVFSHMGFYMHYYHYLIIGALCSILGQLGDLFASSIKRFCNIKDYSSILPGHGGILDRFDSVLFTTPTLYLYIIIVFKLSI